MHKRERHECNDTSDGEREFLKSMRKSYDPIDTPSFEAVMKKLRDPAADAGDVLVLCIEVGAGTLAQAFDLLRSKDNAAVRATFQVVWEHFVMMPTVPFKVTLEPQNAYPAKRWAEWAGLDGDMAMIGATPLDMCFYYASYVSNVRRYGKWVLRNDPSVAEQLQQQEGEEEDDGVQLMDLSPQKQQQPQTLEGVLRAAADAYHEIVPACLAVLVNRAIAGRPVLDLIALKNKNTKANQHLFHRLFGFSKKILNDGGVPASDRLYIPAQYLFATKWTSVNIDGHAFRLYHSMPEFARLNLSAVRLMNADKLAHSTLLSKEANLKELSIISRKDVNAFKGTKNLLGPRLSAPLRLSKLELVDLPSLSRFPVPGRMLASLKELRLSKLQNANLDIVKFVSSLLSVPKSKLKTLALKELALSDPDMMKWCVLQDTALDSLSLESLKGITTLPDCRAVPSCKTLLLSGLSVPLVEYIGILQLNCSEVELRKLLILHNSPVEGGAPFSSAFLYPELDAVLGRRDPGLKKLVLSDFEMLVDFQQSLQGKVGLTHLSIINTGRLQGEKISIPFKHLPALEKVVIDDPKTAYSESMTPTTLLYWNRQMALRATGPVAAASPPKKKQQQQQQQSPIAAFSALSDGGDGVVAEGGPVVRSLEEMFEDREEMSVSAVSDGGGESEESEAVIADSFNALKDMYVPFGAAMKKGPNGDDLDRMEIPEWLPRDLETLAPGNPFKLLFSQTWHEWESEVVQWLAAPCEGIQLRVGSDAQLMNTIVGVQVSKKTNIVDGEPFSVTFNGVSARMTTGVQEDDNQVAEEEDIFWSKLGRGGFQAALQYTRKERLIGVNETTGLPIFCTELKLTYPLQPRNNEGVAFGEELIDEDDHDEDDEEEPVDAKRVRRIPLDYVDTLSKTRFSLGRLTLYYEYANSRNPYRFRLTIELEAAIRFFSLLNLVSLCAVDPKLQLKQVAGGEKFDEYEVAENAFIERLQVPEMQASMSPNEVQRQTALHSIASVCSQIVTATPFFQDDTDSRALEMVQTENDRFLFSSYLLVMYAQTLGTRYVLSSIRNVELRRHVESVIYPQVLVPVSKWCVATSPAQNDPSIAAQYAVTLPLSARFVSMLESMRDTMANGNKDDIGFVMEQLLPSPELEEDDPTAVFLSTKTEFDQEIDDALDALPEKERDELYYASADSTRCLKRLTDVFTLAKREHSGDGQYLDLAEVSDFVLKEIDHEKLFEEWIAVINKSISILAPKSGSPAAESPQKKRSKLQEARDQPLAVISSVQPEFVPSVVVASPSPVKVIIKPKKRAAPSQQQEKAPSPQKSGTPSPSRLPAPSPSAFSSSPVPVPVALSPFGPPQPEIEIFSRRSPFSASTSTSSNTVTPVKGRKPRRQQKPQQQQQQPPSKSGGSGSASDPFVLSQISSSCANCAASQPQWKCRACMGIAYCGEACQVEHWETVHQHECN